MLKTNLKIALRNLYREKLYAAINIAGLALAITCCLILGLYLRTELTYDQHFDNHENIYRIVSEYMISGQPQAFALSSTGLGPLMVADFEEIEAYVNFRRVPEPIFIRNENFADRWQAFTVTHDVFEVFSHDILFGDPEQEFISQRSVAISETFAQRYFGDANPVGELLENEWNELGEPFVVALVFADLPENTHLKYDLLILSDLFTSFSLDDRDLTSLERGLFVQPQNYIYLKTSEGFDPDNFPAMANAFFERHMLERANEIGDFSVEFTMEPLSEIHYHSGMPSDQPQGNPAYLYAFGIVALFILIIACINYTNLATARSIKRSKEVGLRKILGAEKAGLMVQFFVEATLYALISTLIAVVLLEILLDIPVVSQLLGKSLSFSLIEEPQMLLWLALVTVGIGLMAGIYPAVYLSSWAPLSALVSSGKSTGKGNIVFRQVLVLIQFTITITVIAATLLMSNQMRFVTTRDLGFDKNNLITIRMIGMDLIQKTEVIKSELLGHPDIQGATQSERLLGQELQLDPVRVENSEGVDIRIFVNHTDIDTDYLSVMGMEIVAGRDFSESLLTDVDNRIIVNEAMVRQMGWDDPIGKLFGGSPIIGVVKDFNFSSLHNEIEPLVLPLIGDGPTNAGGPSGQVRYLTLRLSGENTSETLLYIQDRFAEFDPVHPVQIEFLDDQLNELYGAENTMMRLVGIFAGVCIFIAALGLFGLASFTTEQRSKEIAIRKVLGASTGQIIGMLSKNVLGLTLIGAVFASIIAYWAINEWLSSFAYRADISIWSFVIATISALAIAYITMALQSYRTAQSDPVDALRSE